MSHKNTLHALLPKGHPERAAYYGHMKTVCGRTHNTYNDEREDSPTEVQYAIETAQANQGWFEQYAPCGECWDPLLILSVSGI